MLMRVLGIILIAAGVIIMLTGKGKSQKAKWLVPGIISAILTSSAIIITKKELGTINTLIAASLCMTVALLISLISVFIRGIRSGLSRVAPAEITYSVLSGACICLSLFLFNKSLINANTSISYAIIHITTAITMLLSSVCFKEKLSWKTACGLLLILGGASILIFIVGTYKF